MEHDGCKGCVYVSRGEHEEPCAKCTQNASDNYKRMTQADRIRAMSDEELVDFIVGLNDHCLAGIGECDCSDEAAKPCSEVCMKKTRKWLQSEVEE